MKNNILLFTCLFCGTALLQSCEKEKNDIKYITLNENVKSGATYSLDVSSYQDKESLATIATQASSFTISQIDADASTGRNIYHFSTDSKSNAHEKVVIYIAEVKDDHHHGPCNHDHHDNAPETVITVNLDVAP